MGACRLQKINQTPSLLSGNPSLSSVPVLHVNLPSPRCSRADVRSEQCLPWPLFLLPVPAGSFFLRPVCAEYTRLLWPGTVPLLGSSPAPTHTPASLSSGSEVRLAGLAQPPNGFAAWVSAASCWKCHKGQDASCTSFMCPQMLVYCTHEKHSVGMRSVK